jgi:hypothetical protein
MSIEYQENPRIAYFVVFIATLCAISIMGSICWLIYNPDIDHTIKEIRLPSALETSGSIVLGYFLTQARTIFEIFNIKEKLQNKKTIIIISYYWPIIVLAIMLLVLLFFKDKYPSINYPSILTSWLFMIVGGYFGIMFGNDRMIELSDEFKSGLWLISGGLALILVFISCYNLMIIPKQEITKGSEIIISYDKNYEIFGGLALGYFFTKIRVLFNIYQKNIINNGLFDYLFRIGFFFAITLVILLIGTFLAFNIKAGTALGSEIKIQSFFQAWVFTTLGFVFGSAGDALQSIQETTKHEITNSENQQS